MDRLRPFHETIVMAIKRCPSPSSGEIIHLFQLIKETKIPAGHDKIIEAIDEYFHFSGGNKWAKDIREVKESIIEQKIRAERGRIDRETRRFELMH